MTSPPTAADPYDAHLRGRLLDLVHGIAPCDDVERAHLHTAAAWVAGGAQLYRLRKPDVPATHLVSYFVVRDASRGELLLVAHRKAGLWLPTGGHVEPGEDPWAAVERECREELGIPAAASELTGPRPLFLTVTRTRGQGAHTDVSLWYVVDADADSVVAWDQEEFSAVRWAAPEQILDEPLTSLDPHMHRFIRKLEHALRG
ncbi:NUDIX domain-containing protein [Streptomyces actuosus]|uniref:NUDIX domain-containing protein n=1 Tax=Streptomyces actuosus TaxID=1885 RepID=A0ABS2VHK3_STRAS|nr:NUDIX domain-containing protein [Streptomyces actuosus]MBN0042571.1 NUDIX domain-containing protein [Streptomyces actuosus]